MAGKSSPVTITSIAQHLLRAKPQKLGLPPRDTAGNAATKNGTSTSSVNSAANPHAIVNLAVASARSARRPGSPTSAKSDAEAQKKEADLRAMAIRQMTEHLADKPNGTAMAPPPWYRRDGDRFSIAHNRPLSWIKDWETGKVRPRIMMDDFKEVRVGTMEVATAAQPEARSKKRKAPVEPDTTFNRVRFYREKRLGLVPTFRHCTTSLLTLNPNKIVSVETKIDSGYDADGESDSD